MTTDSNLQLSSGHRRLRSFVSAIIVPIADDRRLAKQSFADVKEVDDRPFIQATPRQPAIQLLCLDSRYCRGASFGLAPVD
jgi:hypothetical protein